MSLKSIVGPAQPKIIKVKGFLLDKPVIILIDNGATDNFKSKLLSEDCQILVDYSIQFDLLLGDEHSIQWGI